MFICLEGIAGGGKTTQARLLANYLTRVKGKKVFISAVFEGKKRKLITDFIAATDMRSDQNAIMFLFQSLHALQYQEVSEALTAGKVVIADRWSDSFFAHHLYKKTFGIDAELMRKINKLAYRDLKPDMCFLIDIPPALAYKRYIAREKALKDTGLDLMDWEYFVSVVKYYRQLARKRGYVVIDGTQEPQLISRTITKVIEGKKW